MMDFPVGYDEILERVACVNPVRYGRSRNFIDGAVSYLSPYISRGVISTRQVYEAVAASNLGAPAMEKFVQELAWRDYWQQLWIAHGAAIDADLRQPQLHNARSGMPQCMQAGKTGIDAIDQGIMDLYQTGYMHNHLRMYTAALACNVGQCGWKVPARWMYYHLLDGDWASNALSWQWVCGANSQKLYYANQENINKYCHTDQRNTYLDIPYEAFERLHTPDILQAVTTPRLATPLLTTSSVDLDASLPTLIYNYYNLDPQWRKEFKANRILLLEPSVFESYPVSQKCMDFMTHLAQANIPGIQVWVGEFKEIQAKVGAEIYFKEHPLNRYQGTADPRDWLSTVQGEFPSFFAFWNRCKRELL